MARVIIPDRRYYSDEILPGVTLEKFYPGGKDGPNGETHFNTIGGQAWSEIIMLGGADDAFQMALPDIRMPRNQFWPLHWHDCWTVVLIVEGECLIGDWLLKEGDLFIAAPSIEYGPLLVGPQGCRLFEIFAQMHLSPGGYGEEFRDHPTLATTGAAFLPRSEINGRNNGRQLQPCDNVPGIWRDVLVPGKVWDLGDPADPERSLMKFTRLAPGEALAGRDYADWSALVLLKGSATMDAHELERDSFLLVQPGSTLDDLKAGACGADVLELCRTAR